jgi:hypothetical protein
MSICATPGNRDLRLAARPVSEIDAGGKVWTIPPDRMKAAREHRVPPTDRALTILVEMKKARVSDYVFPGQWPDRPLAGRANCIREPEYCRIGQPSRFQGGLRPRAQDRRQWADMANGGG